MNGDKFSMTKTIRSLQRGLQVLKALHATPISSLQDVYHLTQIPKPTLLRILHTLEQSGVVSRRLADGRYRISANLTRMARKRDRYDRVAEDEAAPSSIVCARRFHGRPIFWSPRCGPHGNTRTSRTQSVLDLLQQGQGGHTGELAVVCRRSRLPCHCPRTGAPK